MGGLKSISKKIKKFFKKLGKQIKTNLKHGAKYIAPVLISAMTGGFGSGIVKSLFDNKIAGSLANFGNNTIGRLFGGRASTAALPNAEQVAEGAEALGGAVNSSAIPAISGAFGMGTGIEAIPEITSKALTPVLGNAASSGVLANGANLAKTLVGSNALAKSIDNGVGQLISKAALDNATGKLLKTYGNTDGRVGYGNNTVSSGNLDFLKNTPQNLGDRAEGIEVDPTNIADVTPPSYISQDDFRKQLKTELGIKEDEDEEEKKKNLLANTSFNSRR